MVIKAFKQEYTASQIVAIVVGMIGLCCVLGYAIYELYNTCISIKNMKSKKLK